ncbi:unnamed protein product [Brassica oleracea var. botrytis]
MRLHSSSASARCCNLFCSSHKANARESEWKFQVPVKHKDLEFLIKRFAPPLTAVLLAVSPICNPPEEQQCLIELVLGVDTEEEIYRVTYFGKGRMPGFGEKCTPRGQCTFGPRLQDEEIKLLSEFVKLQADQGWPNVSTD